MSKRDEFNQNAEGTPYDNSDSVLISDDVKTALDEISLNVGQSASPGFTWGRGGNLSTNTWLFNDSVPSNRAGRTVNLIGPAITAVSIANEDINTFDVSFYEHDGDEVNLALMGTVSVVAARSFDAFVTIPLIQGKQIAVRITAGSAKNIVVGLQLSGSIS